MDDQGPVPSPGSSFCGGDASRGASPSPSDFCEQSTACSRCGAIFSTTFRRHHCRQCGALVCDDCSRQRLRLPRNPSWGKVRVCDECAVAIGQNHASGFEEDLLVNSEIITQLRSALARSQSENEAFKKVLLELDVEAMRTIGDQTACISDREDSTCCTFDNLKDRAQQQWAVLLESIDQHSRLHEELVNRRIKSLERREEAAAHQREILCRHAALDEQLAELACCEGERDELVRKAADLEQAVVVARRRVQQLELERREHQERLAQQQQVRWGTGRIANPPASSPPRSPTQGLQAFTISTGRQDPLLSSSVGNRLQGCRRSCTTM